MKAPAARASGMGFGMNAVEQSNNFGPQLPQFGTMHPRQDLQAGGAIRRQ